MAVNIDFLLLDNPPNSRHRNFLYVVISMPWVIHWVEHAEQGAARLHSCTPALHWLFEYSLLGKELQNPILEHSQGLSFLASQVPLEVVGVQLKAPRNLSKYLVRIKNCSGNTLLRFLRRATSQGLYLCDFKKGTAQVTWSMHRRCSSGDICRFNMPQFKLWRRVAVHWVQNWQVNHVRRRRKLLKFI